MRLFLCTILAIILATPALAQVYSRPDDMDYFKKLEEVKLQADVGYLLVRMGENSKGYETNFTLIRKLKNAEVEAYEEVKKVKFEKAFAKNEKKRNSRIEAKAKAEEKGEPYTKSIPGVLTYDRYVFDYADTQNVYVVNARKEYEKGDYGRTMMVQLNPGKYVLVDVGGVCMCLGSVQFEIKPGVINDMGFIISDLADRYDEPSKYPEIAEAVKDHGVYRTGFFYQVSTIRPLTDEMAVPAPLQNLPREAVEYHAMGKMPVYFSTLIDRLVTIPGVLGYQRDKVVDLRTGQMLE